MTTQIATLIIVGCLLLSIASVHGLEYSTATSTRMTEFSLAAYCTGPISIGVGDWDCQMCQKHPQMTDITEFDSGILDNSIHGFVAYDPDYPAIVVSFSGTNPASIANWLTDLDFTKVDYELAPDCNCQVHRGFYDGYNNVRDQVWAGIDAITSKYGSDINLQITGHSLGGALSTHCALDAYVNHNMVPEHVYTQGEPRVGDSDFAAYYSARITTAFRVTHRKDPVPVGVLTLFGFRHHPLEIFYPDASDGDFVICDGSGEDGSCSKRYLFYNPLDHLSYMGYDWLDNYISCLLLPDLAQQAQGAKEMHSYENDDHTSDYYAGFYAGVHEGDDRAGGNSRALELKPVSAYQYQYQHYVYLSTAQWILLIAVVFVVVVMNGYGVYRCSFALRKATQKSYASVNTGAEIDAQPQRAEA
jgi:hypothetical protein